jgi:hypothetical protein
MVYIALGGGGGEVAKTEAEAEPDAAAEAAAGGEAEEAPKVGKGPSCGIELSPDKLTNSIKLFMANIKYTLTVIAGSLVFVSIFPALPFFFMLSVILASMKYFMLKVRSL